MPSDKHVAIAGAGIAGLCAAYWLQKHGFDVTVFEKSDHIGGAIVTEKQDGFLIDLGPNSALETSDTLRHLIDEIGLGEQKVYGNEASNNRYVVRNGKLYPIPMSPLAFIRTPLFSARAKLRLLKEPFIKATNGEDLSLADFVRYRLGEEFLNYAINPFVAGVYAGDPENLSTAAAFPKLYALEQKYGSFIKGAIRGARERKKRGEVAKDRAKLFSFVDGMHIFPETLKHKLSGRILTNCAVTNIRKDGASFVISVNKNGILVEEKFDRLILSSPADSLAEMMKTLAPHAVPILQGIAYPPVAVVFMGFRESDVQRDLDGFGFLVPKLEKRNILGTIWSSTIFPKRALAGYVAFTTFVGGTRQPQNVSVDDATLIDWVVQDLKDLVQLKGKPELVRIKRWPRAIPQYTMGYPDIQKMFERLESDHQGLYFAGNFRRGIGMGDSVLSAHETVQKILHKKTN